MKKTQKTENPVVEYPQKKEEEMETPTFLIYSQ